jgi:hypothetical protein
MNKIYSDEEYKKQGFATEEIPLIKKHDELINKQIVKGNLLEEEEKELYNLIKTLKL